MYGHIHPRQLANSSPCGETLSKDAPDVVLDRLMRGMHVVTDGRANAAKLVDGRLDTVDRGAQTLEIGERRPPARKPH